MVGSIRRPWLRRDSNVNTSALRAVSERTRRFEPRPQVSVRLGQRPVKVVLLRRSYASMWCMMLCTIYRDCII
jgi:hypothetical protein